MMSDLAPKWVMLDTNGTNLGHFKISFCTFWLAKDKFFFLRQFLAMFLQYLAYNLY